MPGPDSLRSQDEYADGFQSDRESPHRPLKSDRHIRLLTWSKINVSSVLNSFRSSSRQVRVFLRQHPIDKAPPYYAVSYAWGDRCDQVEIICDGQRLTIPRNLEAALVGLRDHVEKLPFTGVGDGRVPQGTYWADAICINQQDDKEKAAQIRLMPKIYGEATSVVVWLNSSLDKAATLRSLDHIRALETIERMVHEGHIAEDARGPSGHDRSLVAFANYVLAGRGSIVDNILHDLRADWKRKDARPTERITERDLELARVPHIDYDSLNHLLRSSWFDRAWINQEIALAYTANLYIGPYKVRLDSLQRAISVICDIETDLTIFAGSNIDKLMRILSMWRTHQKKLPVSLLKAASMCRVCDATKPQDKIYSVLSLVTTAGSQFPIDYSTPWPEVYTKFSRSAILETRSLEVLSHCEWKIDQHTDLPSWAPDWTNRHFARFPLSAGFLAGGQSLVSFDFPDAHRLRLSAFLVDQIESVSAVCPALGNDEVTISEQRAFLMDAEDLFFNASSTSAYERSIQAFLQTLVCERSIRSSFLLRRSGHDLPEPVPAFCWYTLRSQRLLGDFRLNFSVDDDQAQQLAAAWERMVLQTCSTARLFTTKRGYIGVGPSSTQLGHEVMIPMGSECPFVVEALVEGDYRLLGDSYVHRLMDGEVLELGLPAREVLLV